MAARESDRPQFNNQDTLHNMSNKDDFAVVKLKAEKVKKYTSFYLYVASLIVNLNLITLGIMVVWISPASTKLLSLDPEENPLGRPISTLELSLLGSLPQIGMLIGTILLGFTFDKFGRKLSLLVINLLIVVSLVGLAFSKSIILYLLCILSIGTLLGGTNVGVPMYLGEITEDHNRAKISCYMGLFMPIGNLYGFVLGSFLSIKVFTLLSALPSLILVICFQIFLPESPTYLLLNNKRENALAAVKKLLGNDSVRAEEVVQEIEFTLSKTGKKNKASISVIWSDKATRNGLITACTLMILSITSGLPAIMSFLEPVFDAAGTEISGSMYSIIVGIVQVFCYFAAAMLVEKWGRRPLLLLSASSSLIPLFTLGLYFYFLNIGSPLVEDLKWIPVFGIILLIMTSVIGLCSVALAYMNEVFVSNIKATAFSMIYFVSGIILSVFVFLFPIMMKDLGLAWTFWIYFIFTLLGFVFIYFKVPETKGKNILEIQEILGK